MKIAVIAGTRFDTALGCSLLERSGILCHPIPMARTPEEQNLLQYTNTNGLQQTMEEAVNRLEHRGFQGVMVFCNSLASSINMDQLRQQTSLPIITPLDVYQNMPDQWQRILLMTANAHTLGTIEALLLARNAHMEITGFSSLDLIKRIEHQEARQVMADYPLNHLLALTRQQNLEAIVLGCTHLTKIFDHIRAITPLPVMDTGTIMAEMVKASLT
ncbi:aspartate/glutamate racemase family protein [Desulfoplanes formicivorans]|uniref:Glutamate racemase n=1 Tax=Desulfoplanes formicivorans TaxID=1592317 RepID=A0A194AHY8_9BACT|nr:aspartate/glutamate racemase family protein [Desulfoplanes formicivorans]GAU08840.1 glutamate racemase [Desulfoplanes formicivorans]